MRPRLSPHCWTAYSRGSRSWRRSGDWSTGASRGAASAFAGSWPTGGPTPMPRGPCRTRSRWKTLLERGGIAFLPRRDNRVPSKPLPHAAAASLGESLGECGIGRDALDRLGDCRGIFRRNEETRFAINDDVGDAADRAADDWNPITQRLEQHHAEPFGVAALIDDRRQHENARLLQCAMQIGLRDTAWHLYAADEAECAHLRLELRAIGTLTENHKLCRDGCGQLVKGIDQIADAFA